MRVWFAILFSLMVAGTQPALVVNNLIAASADCCGGCPETCCDAAPDDAETVPFPVSSVPTTSPQNDLQFVSVLIGHLSLDFSEDACLFSSPFSYPSFVSSVPLFERDCSYLI